MYIVWPILGTLKSGEHFRCDGTNVIELRDGDRWLCKRGRRLKGTQYMRQSEVLLGADG